MLRIICLVKRIVLDGAEAGVIATVSDTPAPHSDSAPSDQQTDGTDSYAGQQF